VNTEQKSKEFIPKRNYVFRKGRLLTPAYRLILTWINNDNRSCKEEVVNPLLVFAKQQQRASEI